MHLLNCVSHMQSEIEQRPFWFRRKFEKRALLFYRVFRNLSFGNLPGFLWCEAIRIPAFFIFKKGAGSQLLIFSRSPVTKIRVNILPGKFNITSTNIAHEEMFTFARTFSSEIKSEHHFCICSTLYMQTFWGLALSTYPRKAKQFPFANSDMP